MDRVIRRLERAASWDAGGSELPFFGFFGCVVLGFVAGGLIDTGVGGGMAWSPALYAGLLVGAGAALAALTIIVWSCRASYASDWANRVRRRPDLRTVYRQDCAPEVVQRERAEARVRNAGALMQHDRWY